MANSNYAKNMGYVVDSHALVIGEQSVMTYIIRNDGTSPAYISKFGYAQEQVNLVASSSISSCVSIFPGAGSTKGPVPTYFKFQTISNEPLGLYTFAAGDGEITNDGLTLTPTGVEGIKINLDPRTEEGPPAWFITVEPVWFSTSTAAPTMRFKLLIELLGEVNSSITLGKAVDSGASVYRYSQTKPENPIVSKDHPLFPPSRPL